MSSHVTTALRICPFCEATCGLALTLSDGVVTGVRGDRDDVFSHGFVCPKGAAITELHDDPDRLRTPLVRRNGTLEPATWDEAYAEVARRLPPILAAHGADSLAVYLGNPNVHNLSLSIYGQAFLRTARTKNLFTASTVDQIPKQLSSGLMFGTFLTVAVPDIDRSDYLLILGANPLDSNGSLWTVPDFPGRLRALQQRGGRCVVVDPKRTRTAEAADRHLFIRPGSDAYLLAALANVIVAEALVRLRGLEAHVNGLDEAIRAVQVFTPEKVAPICGIAAADIAALARELASAERAVVYGRIGTCTQAYGTAASWLVDVLNVLTGNLDRPGGAMFPHAPALAANTMGQPGVGRGVRIGRRHSRVRGAPEVQGELPVACMSEEIETPGEGQIRALVTIAGNPVLSTPNGARLGRALEQLEFMVSLDIYLNETTQHADVILPGGSPLEESHFDIAFNQFACRNAARFSPPTLPGPADRPHEWQTLLRLAGIVAGQGADADLEMLDGMVISSQVQSAVASEHSSVFGRDPAELMQALEPRRGPERVLDFALRSGPYGDGFGSRPGGLSLAALEATPHGIDLGALEPRLPEILRTPSGKIELAPQLLITEMKRLADTLGQASEDGMVLIGRRHLRSNNSWMHNLPRLAGGRSRCTLQIHPLDAERLALNEGDKARVTSRTGAVEVEVEITDAIMAGVVSLPHGWGHDHADARLRVAAERPGVNSNLLADEEQLDPLSGNAVLNGIPVEVVCA